MTALVAAGARHRPLATRTSSTLPPTPCAGDGSRPRALPGPGRSTAPSRWSTSFGTSGCTPAAAKACSWSPSRPSTTCWPARQGPHRGRGGEAVAACGPTTSSPGRRSSRSRPGRALDGRWSTSSTGSRSTISWATSNRSSTRSARCARRVAAARRPRPAVPLDHYDAERLTWTWRSEEPAVDDLQQRLAALVEAGTAKDRPTGATYLAVARPSERRPATPASRSCPPARSKGGHGSPSRGSAERSPGSRFGPLRNALGHYCSEKGGYSSRISPAYACTRAVQRPTPTMYCRGLPASAR